MGKRGECFHAFGGWPSCLSMSQANHARSQSEQIVHVRTDSDSQLDALFNVLKPKPGQQSPSNIPFAQRNLPPSFFTPPDPRPGNHSRESSTDSTQYGTGKIPAGLTVSHARSVSSPAQLPTAGLSPAPQPQHVKTPSDRQLPSGWEMAKTDEGQRYFLK